MTLAVAYVAPEFVKIVVADHAVFQLHALAASEAMLDIIFVEPDDLDINGRKVRSSSATTCAQNSVFPPFRGLHA